MMAPVFTTLFACLLCAAQARLVFPPGSDVGYIVSDDQEKFEDTNGINELDNVDEYAMQLLRRAERETADAVRSALLQTIKNRLSRSERSEADDSPKAEDPVGQWLGKWFPHPPQVGGQNRMPPAAAAAPPDLPENMKDAKHGVAMGISHVKCDNGKVNLTLDWDESPVNYTCFDPKRHRLPVREDLKSVSKCVPIPHRYVPQHYCMNTRIAYNSTIPLFGPHRPLWPAYGEYVFLPPQRWLHTIEHGGVVMLYHPCTEPIIVQRLKKVLRDCFRKHVITPNNHLTIERPLALIAWGCSIEMATVDIDEVKAFIKKRALHGPEGHLARDGTYKHHLKIKAEYPPGSDGTDKDFCPMDKP